MGRKSQIGQWTVPAGEDLCGALMLDASGTVLQCDATAGRVLGVAEPIGKPLGELLPDVAGLKEALARRDTGLVGECRLHLDGREQTFRVLLLPMKPAREASAGAICLLRDAGLGDTREQLLQAQKMETFGQLAGGMAHNFSNALTIVIGCNDIALEYLDDRHPAVKHLQRLKQAAQEAAGTVSNLMSYSRRYQPHLRTVELGALLQQRRELLSLLLPADIGLDVQAAKQPAWVEIDEHLIEQAIVNLVINACDAIEVSGEIRIHLEIEGESAVRIDVGDTGHGIPEDILDQVFEPFFTTKDSGTGLGLFTCREIVEAHNGSIEVHSRPGEGATFVIRLPLA